MITKICKKSNKVLYFADKIGSMWVVKASKENSNKGKRYEGTFTDKQFKRLRNDLKF